MTTQQQTSHTKRSQTPPTTPPPTKRRELPPTRQMFASGNYGVYKGAPPITLGLYFLTPPTSTPTTAGYDNTYGVYKGLVL